jgi:hypothetical protein
MATSLDPLFVDSLNKLAADSAEVYIQHNTGVGGVWSTPPVNTSWTGDLFDYDTLAFAFDRSSIESEYVKAIESAKDPAILDEGLADPEENPLRGTTADLAANKMQAGILSQRERAFRARHATPIMAACHAASRRKGHGHNDGEAVGIFGLIVNHVSDMINHGK